MVPGAAGTSCVSIDDCVEGLLCLEGTCSLGAVDEIEQADVALDSDDDDADVVEIVDVLEAEDEPDAVPDDPCVDLGVDRCALICRPPACTNMCGDVTGDGVVDICDAQAVRLYPAGLDYTPCMRMVADVNNDFLVDQQDAVAIEQYELTGESSYLQCVLP